MSTNLEIFNAYNNALIAGDFAALFETMADDIIWHQPGNQSSRLVVLLPPSSLRTVRESFPSYGSSISLLFRAALNK